MSQLSLPLDRPAGAREDHFLVGQANERAVQMLDRWATWPVMTAIITGPRKSGRSLLARTMVARSGGAVIDDADLQSETMLFHAWNEAQSERRPLFLVANDAPPEWDVKLPDLRSRLASSPLARIDEPDDALAVGILRQFFDRHELVAQDDVVAWVMRRIERTYLSILRTGEALEEDASRRRNRRLSIPTARATLTGAGLLRDAGASG
ncbi:chromosomal replication initiator DnaA [Sphingomonas turrisvirgatae]|uniref:Chromosomal replication initiator DnaA n=1 Tax=Sphingomonas turrisvirgatae TaxID=1888892 RepID=A0A1E3M074_9SPHN|nr:chromosomal replication initiator DnaA [Sphingomonas turrisvirgatae]ODP39477.1 chromosomal replication initiator DnaA [Sphingomonas turrisvirgatae]